METLITVGGIAALFVVISLLVRNVIVRRRITCPRTQKPVDVEFVRRDLHGETKASQVKSCSAFENPRKVECDQECLKDS